MDFQVVDYKCYLTTIFIVSSSICDVQEPKLPEVDWCSLLIYGENLDHYDQLTFEE